MINLILNRIYKGDSYTIGKLYIDNEYFCDTLEDTVRQLPEKCKYEKAKQQCKCEEKVHGETAIPAGCYKVILTYSNRFKRVLPLLLGVEHFEGVRIHSGNTSKDTQGCILVGINSEKGKVLQSKKTESDLIKRLEGADEIYITIR
jgi:hypothetical protein|nr:MAG TPA: hypothetical protein [Caudoviricetes sp.]